MWTAALKQVVGQVVGCKDYFNEDHTSVDKASETVVFVLMENSIDPELCPLIMGMTAYEVYHRLSLHFDQSSWSLMVSYWNAVDTPHDGSNSLAAAYEAAKQNFIDLEKRLKGLTVDNLTALTFYSSVLSYQ